MQGSDVGCDRGGSLGRSLLLDIAAALADKPIFNWHTRDGREVGMVGEYWNSGVRALVRRVLDKDICKLESKVIL